MPEVGRGGSEKLSLGEGVEGCKGERGDEEERAEDFESGAAGDHAEEARECGCAQSCGGDLEPDGMRREARADLRGGKGNQKREDRGEGEAQGGQAQQSGAARGAEPEEGGGGGGG